MFKTKKLFLTSSIFLVFFCCLMGCKKNSAKTDLPTPSKPAVKFNVQVKSPTAGNLFYASMNYIDSNFYFKNLSDSSNSITYKWDFGDGLVSTDKNPVHKYAKRGHYKVLLLVNSNNKVSDTSSVVLSVVLGEKSIAIDNQTNLRPINAIETPDKGFLIAAVSNTANSPNVYSCSLIKTDSLFKQVSVYHFPANYYFYFFQPSGDGNYFLTGTSSGNVSLDNELFKISASGNILWSKQFSNTTALISVLQPQTDKILILAQNNSLDSYGNTILRTGLFMTDNSGNLLWSKVFNTDLTIQLSYNLLLESDGFVFAGSEPGGSPLSFTDSLIAVKMDYSGNELWHHSSPWSVGAYMPNETFISKSSAGNYFITNAAVTYGLYMVSPQGALINKVPQLPTVIYSYSASDGNILLVHNDATIGSASKVNNQETTIWSKSFESPCYPVNISEFEKDRYLMLGAQIDYFSTGLSSHYNILLLQVDKNGHDL